VSTLTPDRISKRPAAKSAEGRVASARPDAEGASDDKSARSHDCSDQTTTRGQPSLTNLPMVQEPSDVVATIADISGHSSEAASSGMSRAQARADARVDFDIIYREHRGRVLATVRGVMGRSDEIDDVVQLVFIEIHRCLPKFEGRSKLSTWVYRIAVNVALQHLRKRKRKRWLMLGATGEEDGRYASGINPVRRYEDRELLEAVYVSVDKLSAKKRAVWVLHELQGLDPTEIGEALEIPMNTVRSRLLAARREMMADLARRQVIPNRSTTSEEGS
jgi:RNA polymerase sigma-70 factor (ECF subfamily)